MVTAFVLISVEDRSVHETVKTLLPVHGIEAEAVEAGAITVVHRMIAEKNEDSLKDFLGFLKSLQQNVQDA